MSKKEQKIYDLMSAIRKRTQPSEGINVFERLLNEIDNPVLFDSIVSDMNRFIEVFSTLVNNIDKMDDLTLKSKLLTYDFIEPKKYFRRTYLEMIKVLRRLNAVNTYYSEKRVFNMGKRNILGNLPNKVQWMKIVIADDTKKEEIYENIRKEILIWNYMPAMVKAIIMTKRRSLGLDKNSEKFPVD